MKKFTIYLAGDSTVQSYKTPVKPITGWGQMLHTYFKETEQKMKGKTAGKIIALFAVAGMLAGCGGKTGTTPDDYATNDGYITTETAGNSTGGAQSDTTSGTAGISKENIKVGVLYISDPDEGSGYSYTHDRGIVGMQENLGLSDD